MSSEGSSKVVELSFVFLSHLSQSDYGGIFLVDELAEGSFSLDEAVWDVHLLAEGGEPDNEFEGLDVVSNGNKLGLLVLDELGDVIESELEMVGLALGDLFF